MQFYFFFFLVSGFCSILYEVIWLRLAMAQYGVTTPLVSLVLSIFMLGLGLGSWGAGFLVKRWKNRLHFLRLYALTEMLIGISALVVPLEFAWGRQLLESLETHGISSLGFYLVTGVWIAISLVPWCTCMGATFPFAMFGIEDQVGTAAPRSFSYLYLANVFGAVVGAWVPLLLIESLGFRGTLHVGAALNFTVAISAFTLSLCLTKRSASLPLLEAGGWLSGRAPAPSGRQLLWLLFGTGLTSMAAEVIWVRMFTPWLGTVVYAFAAILGFYLAATYVGSLIYRRLVSRIDLSGSLVWSILGFTLVLPLIAADPRVFSKHEFVRLALGAVPLSALLGFLTPAMVDRVSGGDGDRAGRAYAVNIVGCILGPLLAGFLLLPWVGERVSLCLLALPWFAVALFATRSQLTLPESEPAPSRKWVTTALVAIVVVMFFSTTSYETRFAHRWVKRDYAATVVAKGEDRSTKQVLVNGVGMTVLRPVTKMMAHLPLAMLDHKPTNMLVICFGMGTTHRAALSWGISSTVVELIPSVPKVFGYFHQDGPKLLQSPRSHVVIDDGRLFLERTTGQYDVIAIDPPPPVEAAASSLLYSKEFYVLAKRHLRAGGILAQWLPYGDPIVVSSVAKALQESFPYIRVFGGIGGSGYHFLASMSPIPETPASVLASRMPATAVADMLEWGPESSPERQFADALEREIPLDQLIQLYPDAPALVDDRPVNEYYYLRHGPVLFGRVLSMVGR